MTAFAAAALPRPIVTLATPLATLNHNVKENP